MRLRTNFMNQLVVQVSYPLVRVPALGAPSSAGFSDWRDARSTDPREVAAVFGILQGVSKVAT